MYYCVNCGAYLLFDNMALNLISNVVPMFLIMLQYKRPMQTYVFLTVGVCAVGMILDWFLTCINPDFVLMKTNTPQSIMFLGLVFLFRHYFNRKERVILNSKYIVFLVVISVGTIVIAELSGPEFNLKCLVISLILLAINFLNFYLYDRYIENMQFQIMFNAVESSNKAYKNQIKLMNDSQKQIRLLKHDMKNHFLKIQYFLQKQNYIEASDYIAKMTNKISTEKEFVSTGNIDFDCLLNYKLAEAQEQNVDFSFHVVLPEQLLVDSLDLTVIIGNLLDNALNALKNADNKILEIDVNYSIGMIVIKIENTFSDVPQTYDDSGEHGYGLLSVQTSVEKYNGKLQTDIIDDRFVVKAVLYNKAK